MTAPSSCRRTPVVGGIAAWHIPLVAATLGLAALGLGLLEGAVAVGVLGFVAQTLLRGVVLEVSPGGLTRGFVLNGRFLGRTTAMAWDAVASVHTDWRRPGDDTALTTLVGDARGNVIHFTTAMGLDRYGACLAAVAAGAPLARRSGLTDAVLADLPLRRQTVLASTATAGVLALVILALVAVHYLWAQGRSSLARSLEPPVAAGSPSPEPDRPSDRESAGAPR